MTVWIVREGYDCDIVRVFSTREKAEQYLEPGLARWWKRVLDPSDDLEGASGWGGKQWRAEHYATVGYESWRDREYDERIEDVEVDDRVDSETGSELGSTEAQ